MKRIPLQWSILFVLILVAGIGFSFSKTAKPSPTPTTGYQINAEQDGLEAFDKMMSVLTHKRCVNCHPAGDRPLQGEDSHIHNFNVQRGPDNHGVSSLSCNTCHHEENNLNAGVPGAPEWSLAPRAMAWEGKTRVEIAQSILNPEINGGRSLEETVKHLTEHELVLWAWEPGVNNEGIPRELPPLSKNDYINAVKKWAEAGAPIPEK